MFIVSTHLKSCHRQFSSQRARVPNRKYQTLTLAVSHSPQAIADIVALYGKLTVNTTEKNPQKNWGKTLFPQLFSSTFINIFFCGIYTTEQSFLKSSWQVSTQALRQCEKIVEMGKKLNLSKTPRRNPYTNPWKSNNFFLLVLHSKKVF